MPRLFRARACGLITAVLLAAGTTSAALDQFLHGTASHDACASLDDLGHDASTHRFDAPEGGPSPDGHCVGCHLARAPRAGAQAVSILGHAGETATLRPIAAIGSARAAALDGLPPRSPPPPA
jgi:hypothetical protein